MIELRRCGTGIFARTSLLFVPASQTILAGSSCARACGARNGRSFDALRHDFAALDSLRSSRVERSSRAVTLVSWAETGKGIPCRIPPLSQTARKRWAPGFLTPVM